MVFVSLEGFVGAPQKAAPNASSPLAKVQSQHQKPQVHVLVTPGAPVKPSVASTKQSQPQMIRAKSSWTLRAAPVVSDNGSASTTVATMPLVMYVTDQYVHQKWVVHKTALEYQQLRSSMQRVMASGAAACRKTDCCDSLRHIVKNSRPMSKRASSTVVAQLNHCGVIETYVNSLAQATSTTSDSPCDRVLQAQHLLHDFLDIKRRRAIAAEHEFQRQSIARLRRASTYGEDPIECSICCGQLVESPKERLACGHLFHSHCINVWFQLQHTCPMCRLDLPPNSSMAA